MIALRRTRLWLGTALAIVVAAPAGAATLLDIYKDAAAYNHEFQAARANLAAGRANVAIGRSALLPQVSGVASYTETEEGERSAGFAVGEGGEPVDPALQELLLLFNGIGGGRPDGGQYQFNLQQVLFDASAWFGYRRGRSLANEAEAVFADAEESLILRTADAYFSVLKAVDDLQSARAEREAFSQQLEQSRQRFEVGLTAITEVHEAQAAFDSATANFLLAEGNVGINFEALEVLTGRAYDAIAPLEQNFPVQGPEPAKLDPWVTRARENNVQLRLARFRADSAELLADASKARHLPTVSAGVTYGGDFPVSGDDTTVYSVNLSLPLFSGGNISASRRQAYSLYLAANELAQQAEREVTQAARVNFVRVNTSVAAVKARAQAIVSSESALEATRAGYEVGTRDLVDVLNAQRTLFAAQRDFYDALYTYIVANLQLREAAGVLGPEDVTQLNEWLDASRRVEFNRVE